MEFPYTSLYPVPRYTCLIKHSFIFLKLPLSSSFSSQKRCAVLLIWPFTLPPSFLNLAFSLRSREKNQKHHNYISSVHHPSYEKKQVVEKNRRSFHSMTAFAEICKAKHLSGQSQITLTCCSVCFYLEIFLTECVGLCMPLQCVGAGPQLAKESYGGRGGVRRWFSASCTLESLGAGELFQCQAWVSVVQGGA